MRTTIVIPDDLFRRVKATAALEGKSLRDFILQAVRYEMDRRIDHRTPESRVKLPLVPSKRPGSLRVTGALVDAILSAEDANALT